MATHSNVLAWRIPGTGEPGGLLSMGSHRVGHDWSDLAAAAALFQTNCQTCSQSGGVSEQVVGQGQAAGLLRYDNYTRRWYRCTLHAQQLLHGYEVICFVFYFFICMHLFHCNRFFNWEAWGWQEICFRSFNTSSSVATASGTVADIENEFETQLNSNLMQILHCLEIQKPLIFIRILKLKHTNKEIENKADDFISV